MRMNWLRLYHEARNDAKLRTLTDSQFRVWFNLLCLASEQLERGTIEDYDEDLLSIEVAAGDIDLLQATIKQLHRLRIISHEGQTISFCHFLDRQYDKPSDRPEAVKERVTRHRETQKADDVTPSNAMKHPVTHRGDKRREEEIREEKSNTPPQFAEDGDNEEPKEKAKRKHRIPDDFCLSEKMVEWAKKRGYDVLLDLEYETEEFHDYWRGRGEPMLNWVATWQSRITKQAASAKGKQEVIRNGRHNGSGLRGGDKQADRSPAETGEYIFGPGFEVEGYPGPRKTG